MKKNQIKLKIVYSNRSKNALAAKAQISPDRLKFIIPAVAYYFTTGPWRNLWIRFGYDPRKDRSSAKYQSLDYRVRVEGGITHKVKKKSIISLSFIGG
jgi:general transcription factor 3C polypeptide 5 (transcription factor C subunit 1)